MNYNTTPTQFGRYELLRLIASGGMGEIFLARLRGVENFEKLLVIKKILPHLAQNERIIQKFLNEGKTLVELNHGNIVSIYDMGKIDDEYYIAMDYIHGSDLRSIIKNYTLKQQSLPINACIYIISEVCKGLSYAHKICDKNGRSLNIIHRDISPSNILISSEGNVKIVDFGIAKAEIQSSNTITGQLQGKFGYMSPEQARAKECDQRSDLFSTAIVLYETLTLQRPFEADNDLQCLELIKSAEYTPPQQLRPDTPDHIAKIIHKALQINPDDRFQNADELFQDLSKHWIITNTVYTATDLVKDLKPENLTPHYQNTNLNPNDFINNAINELIALDTHKNTKFTQSIVSTPGPPSITLPISTNTTDSSPKNFTRILIITLLFSLTLITLLILSKLYDENNNAKHLSPITQKTKQDYTKTPANTQNTNDPQNPIETKLSENTINNDTTSKKTEHTTDNKSWDWLKLNFNLAPNNTTYEILQGISKIDEKNDFYISNQSPILINFYAPNHKPCKINLLFDKEQKQTLPDFTSDNCLSAQILPLSTPNNLQIALTLHPKNPESINNKKTTTTTKPPKNNPPKLTKISIKTNIPATLKTYDAKIYNLPLEIELTPEQLAQNITITPTTNEYKIPWQGTFTQAQDLNFCELLIYVQQSFAPNDPAPIQIADIYINNKKIASAVDRLKLTLPCGTHKIKMQLPKLKLSAQKDLNITTTQNNVLRMAMTPE